MPRPRPRDDCVVEGCDRPWYNRDWCRIHYRHVMRHGDPLGGSFRRTEPVVRRTCAACGVEKDYDEFGLTGQGTDAFGAPYRMGTCKPCRAASVTARRTPEKAQRERERKLAWKYGLSVEDVHALAAIYDGQCHSCQRQPWAVVDHCHASGIVRGLLCHPCNKGLGCFFDDTSLLDAAKNYLQEAGKRATLSA